MTSWRALLSVLIIATHALLLHHQIEHIVQVDEEHSAEECRLCRTSTALLPTPDITPERIVYVLELCHTAPPLVTVAAQDIFWRAPKPRGPPLTNLA